MVLLIRAATGSNIIKGTSRPFGGIQRGPSPTRFSNAKQPQQQRSSAPPRLKRSISEAPAPTYRRYQPYSRPPHKYLPVGNQGPQQSGLRVPQPVPVRLSPHAPRGAPQSFAEQAQGDWRTNVSREDRFGTCQKIKQAYQATCPTYEELLLVAAAMEEQLLHVASGNKQEYVDCALNYTNKVTATRQRIYKTTPSPPRQQFPPQQRSC